MGLMDFLKKKNDAGIGGDGLNLDANRLTSDHTGIPPSNFSGEYQFDQHEQLSPSMSMSSMNGGNFGQQSMHQPMQQESNMEKDVQMISLKLDAIKSELDAINQRLRSLESIAEREQARTISPKKWY